MNSKLERVRLLGDNDSFKTKVLNGYIDTKKSHFPNLEAMEKE